MLNVLRTNIKSFGYPLAIGLALVFVLIVFTEFGSLEGTRMNPDAATVGGDSITFAEFERSYRNAESRYREIYGDAFNADLADQLQLPVQALEALINDRLLIMEAERMGLTVSDEELQDEILAVPGLTDGAGNFIGARQYQDLLRANRLSVDDFEADLRTSLLVRKLQAALTEVAHVSDAEVELRAREAAERAAIRYFQVPASRFAAEAEPSSDEAAAWYEEHREDFRLPERRRVGYLLVSTNTVRAELEVTDDEVQAYYEDNSAQFEIPEQVRASHILLLENSERDAEQARGLLNRLRGRIEAGEDFAELAREYSDDEATKEAGGDLGYFGRGAMTPAFEEAAFGAAGGDLVGPVENQLGPRTGHHLIQVHERREGGRQTLEEVSNLIRVQLLATRAEEEAKSRIDSLRERLADETFAGEEGARELAAAESLVYASTEPFGEDDPVAGIGRNFNFSSAAFDLETGAWSEPVRIAAGWALLSVLEVLPPRDSEFAEVEVDVREVVRRQKETELLAAALTETRERVEGGLGMDDAAEEFDAVIEESGGFGLRQPIGALGALPELSRAAFALSAGQFGGPVDTSFGAVLFEVTERESFDPLLFDSEATRNELLAERNLTMLQSLLQRLRDEVGVHYTQDFIENFGLGEAETAGT
ncbi:MAG: SurA N-terminal domain-containing protein [Acidobacteriota bacterium]|nr:SurA N-terminal domain-containing protein [Acidobacteriota bacterium]